MVDEADRRDVRPTPLAPALSGPVGDNTIKLDLAIANGHLSLPSHFGRYQVFGRTGIGGFPSVYSARAPDLASPAPIALAVTSS